ncbi:MAG: pilus assembly protein [Spiribacter sp.]|nr:pilus assembly protein [Spiribacter sp.]MDR9489678.1 pilus assembly protein [Spiribacter sp.]
MQPPIPSPHRRSLEHQRGQGMSEYIIITALIAVAGIGIFSAFGDTISSQAAAMAREMAGQDGSDQIDQADDDSQRAADRSAEQTTLQNFDAQN